MIEGLRVLLVEDEAIIAMTAEDMLEELGCRLAATAYSLEDALAAATGEDFDVAVLDINLNGERSLPLARELKLLGKPFIFTTGYGIDGPGPDFADIPLVAKPYRTDDLGRAIRLALGAASSS